MYIFQTVSHSSFISRSFSITTTPRSLDNFYAILLLPNVIFTGSFPTSPKTQIYLNQHKSLDLSSQLTQGFYHGPTTFSSNKSRGRKPTAEIHVPYALVSLRSNFSNKNSFLCLRKRLLVDLFASDVFFRWHKKYDTAHGDRRVQQKKRDSSATVMQPTMWTDSALFWVDEDPALGSSLISS